MVRAASAQRRWFDPRDAKLWTALVVLAVGLTLLLTLNLRETAIRPVDIPRTQEELEAEAVRKLLPSEDFLLPSAYQKLINAGPAKFLAAHPTSKYKIEIEAIKKKLQEESDRARLGMRKVEGQWLRGKEIQASEYNINALRSLRKMEKLASADKYQEMLAEFNRLEAAGKLSVSYPKAIGLAKTVLRKYAASLAQDVQSLPPGASLPSLTEATRQVDLETKRLAALDVPAIAAIATQYDRICRLVGQEKFEEAAIRLDEFVRTNQTAASDPQIKRQQEELKKLSEESIRLARQLELLNRTQPKPVSLKPAETSGNK